jgi:proteic killer suppression protein
MILSFADKDTEKLAGLQRVSRFQGFERAALRKLAQLEIAAKLEDLHIPPGNQLEALSGNRKGQYSIRINDQYRICFVWTKNGPLNVEIADYH